MIVCGCMYSLVSSVSPIVSYCIKHPVPLLVPLKVLLCASASPELPYRWPLLWPVSALIPYISVHLFVLICTPLHSFFLFGPLHSMCCCSPSCTFCIPCTSFVLICTPCAACNLLLCILTFTLVLPLSTSKSYVPYFVLYTPACTHHISLCLYVCTSSCTHMHPLVLPEPSILPPFCICLGPLHPVCPQESNWLRVPWLRLLLLLPNVMEHRSLLVVYVFNFYQTLREVPHGTKGTGPRFIMRPVYLRSQLRNNTNTVSTLVLLIRLLQVLCTWYAGIAHHRALQTSGQGWAGSKAVHGMECSGGALALLEISLSRGCCLKCTILPVQGGVLTYSTEC